MKNNFVKIGQYERDMQKMIKKLDRIALELEKLELRMIIKLGGITTIGFSIFPVIERLV